MTRILGVIPARGGSKGLPNKNIVMLCGKPLLAYTAEAATASRYLSRVVLSTDSAEIADVGRSLGLDVPFMRPKELAADETPTLPVLRHAVGFLADEGETFDAVCLLQPTSPLRTVDMVDAACERFVETNADTLLSVLKIPHHHHPDWALLADADGWLHWASGKQDPPPRRQELRPAFHREGSIYIVRVDVLMERGTLFGDRIVPFLVDHKRSVNIDGPEDLARAEKLLAGR